MRRPVARVAVGLGIILAVYIVGAFVAVGLAASTSVEEGISAGGRETVRGFASFATAFESPASPTFIVLVDPPRSLPAEALQIERFVRAGGVLWVVSNDPPSDVLQDDLAPRVLEGALWASNASAPLFTHALGSLREPHLRALDLTGTGYEPILLSDIDAFRDTNGNGRLDAGEPAGPFASAAQRRVGEGLIVLVAAQRSTSPELFTLLAQEMAPGAAVVIDHGLSGSWPFVGRALDRTLGLPTMNAPAAIAAALVGIGFVMFVRGPETTRTAKGTQRTEALIDHYRNRQASKGAHPAGAPPARTTPPSDDR